MDPVIFVQLALTPVSPLEGFANHTLLLSGSHRFKANVVLAFIDPSMTKGPDVSGVFNEVPSVNGKWKLEVAIELPDLLPSLDGKSEAIVSVNTGDDAFAELCISNRMSRFHYQDGVTAYHALLPRTQEWHGTAQVNGDDGEILSAAEEQLRTLASMTFDVSGNSAEEAFESSIKSCVETLLGGVTSVMHATRECSASSTPVKRSMRWDAAPFVYVLMSGNNVSRGARLVLGGTRVFLVPEILEGERAARFRAIASGGEQMSDVRRLLGEARSSWQDAEYEFAFLQAVIAAEMATMRAVHATCVGRGISNKKLKELKKDMTYSMALNVHLPLCFPDDNWPNNSILSAMNKARSLRNNLMHEGSFDLGRLSILKLLSDTKSYIEALEASQKNRI